LAAYLRRDRRTIGFIKPSTKAISDTLGPYSYYYLDN
jgi:hypothetical protein